MPKFIYVPQGCYAAITPDTPAEVIGLVTAGMDPCSHIIVANNATRAMVLCHVDHQTNLEDPANGLSSWIDKVCQDRDYQNLSISIGERPNQSRFIIENDIERTANGNCYNRALRIIGIE